MKSVMCPKHGPYEQKQTEVLGKVFKTNCPACSGERKAQESKAAMSSLSAAKDARIRKLLGESGLPPRFASRTFSNFTATTEEQKRAIAVSQYFAGNFEAFMATGASLVFCGRPGTGKTHLAAAISNAVCHQGRSAVFMSVLKAARMVKDTWRKGSEETESKVYKGLIEPDLLILDEVGVQFGSEAEKLILFEILNGRYENVRPTIVISNLSQAEITEFLGERSMDRLKEGGGSTVVFTWDSYRPKVIDDALLPKADVKPVEWERNSNGYRVVA